MQNRRLIGLILLLSVTTSLNAGTTDDDPVPAGNYATEEGWGQLTVRSGSAGAMTFSIMTNSTGTSGCALRGTLKRSIGTARDGLRACSIHFKRNHDGVELVADPNSATCQELCGANGNFEGEYRAILPLCTPAGVSTARNAFMRDYKARNYSNSVLTLRSVLDHCAPVLDEFQRGAIRNDLALAQYKSGDQGACLATLEPYRADANRRDDEIEKDWSGSPSSLDLLSKYLGLIKAVRTNLRLCSR